MAQKVTVRGAGRWTQAAQLVADDRLSDEQIAASIGVSRTQLARRKHAPDFIAQVQAIIDRQRAALEAEGIANKQNQLRELQAEYDATSSIKQQRAADPKLRMAPGGDTGLVTRKFKSIPNSDPNKPPLTVTEDQVDTGLITARLRILEQAGKVAGWWSEKPAVNVTVNVSVQQEAERIAERLGVPVEVVLREAEYTLGVAS